MYLLPLLISLINVIVTWRDLANDANVRQLCFAALGSFFPNHPYTRRGNTFLGDALRILESISLRVYIQDRLRHFSPKMY